LRNVSNVEDNEYETLVFSYNKELDSLVSTICITRSPKEEESSPPHTKDVMTDLEEETKNIFPPFQCRDGFEKHDPNAYTIVHSGFQ